MNKGSLVGQESSLFLTFSRSSNFSMSLVFFQEVGELREIREFVKIHEINEIQENLGSRSLLGDWLRNWQLGGEKIIVLCID